MNNSININEAWTRFSQALVRSLPTVLILCAGASLLAWIIVETRGETKEVHFSYLVSLREQEITETYRFDGFYALQATDLFSSTLAEWITTPSVIVKAYELADIPLVTRDARRLSRVVTAVKSAPQLIEVTVRASSDEIANNLAQGLIKSMNINIEDYHSQGIPALSFNVYATDSWTGVNKLSSPVIVVASFFFTFVLLVNFVLLRESFRGTGAPNR